MRRNAPRTVGGRFRETRSSERHEAVSRVFGQADADRRERRVGHGEFVCDDNVDDGHASGSSAGVSGADVQVYDSTLTTNRGSCNVQSADPISPIQTITVDVNPGGLTNGDVIVHDGLTGAQPSSLYGLKYHQNNSTTGTWLNLNRATYPVKLATPRVNAGNAALTPANVRLAINKVRKALGINHLSKLIAYMAVEQEHAWENLGITVSQIIKEGGSGSSNDLGPAIYRAEDDERNSDQVQRECGSDPRGFSGSVALGPRGLEGHRFLRGEWEYGVPDLWGERRDRCGLHLLLRYGVSGVERFAAEWSVYRYAGTAERVLERQSVVDSRQSTAGVRL